MTRAAARRNALHDRDGKPQLRNLCQGVKVRRPRLLQLCLSICSQRQSPQTIHNNEKNLCFGRNLKLFDKVKPVHNISLLFMA